MRAVAARRVCVCSPSVCTQRYYVYSTWCDVCVNVQVQCGVWCVVLSEAHNEWVTCSNVTWCLYVTWCGVHMWRRVEPCDGLQARKTSQGHVTENQGVTEARGERVARSAWMTEMIK